MSPQYEKQQRKRALAAWRDGETPSEIAKRHHRSTQWVKAQIEKSKRVMNLHGEGYKPSEIAEKVGENVPWVSAQIVLAGVQSERARQQQKALERQREQKRQRRAQAEDFRDVTGTLLESVDAVYRRVCYVQV